jgi:hypothetical protein
MESGARCQRAGAFSYQHADGKAKSPTEGEALANQRNLRTQSATVSASMINDAKQFQD